jgi:hypothetical protein
LIGSPAKTGTIPDIFDESMQSDPKTGLTRPAAFMTGCRKKDIGGDHADFADRRGARPPNPTNLLLEFGSFGRVPSWDFSP